MSKQQISTRHSGIAKLELLLGLALLSLLFQLFPDLWWYFDIRNWTRTTWFFLNAVVLSSLLVKRFSADLLNDWREKKIKRNADRTKAEKVRALKEQKEAIQRMQASRHRRRY